MTVETKLTRRAVLVSAASAAALSQIGCGINRPPSLPDPWLAHEVSFYGDFAEKDTSGRGYIRCISPVIFGYDAGRRILGIERYDGNAPGSRGVVNVWIDKATRTHLSADNGPIMYACSIGNVGTEQFVADVLTAFSRIGFLDRPGYTPVPSHSFLPVDSRELTIDTILACSAHHRIEVDGPGIDLDATRREVAALDDIKLLSIEAAHSRDAKRFSLDIEVSGRAGEIGDASQGVLRVFAAAAPSDHTTGNHAFIRP